MTRSEALRQNETIYACCLIAVAY